MARLKVGVLASGRGSNLAALIEAAADPAFPAEIALVIANVKGAAALARADAAGIPTKVIEHRAFASRARWASWDHPSFQHACPEPIAAIYVCSLQCMSNSSVQTHIVLKEIFPIVL